MPEFRVAIVPVTMFQQNCSLVWNTETLEAAVVDPGGEPEKILDAIGRLGLNVTVILLTHGHLDHAGGAKMLKQALDAGRATAVPIVGPDARDQFLLDEIEESQRRFGFSGMHNVTPDRYVVEGETVTFGGLSFDVLHVPGHTPGHVVFVEREKRFALAGDTLFQGSVGRTDFPYGDGPRLIAGIRAKMLPLGDDITFVPGHGPASTFGAERESNPFLQD